MNKTIGRRKIENIKNVLLVVLSLSAILLLYFFWEDISFKNFSFDDLALTEQGEVFRSITAEEVLVPNEIILSMGEDTYSVISEDKSKWWSNTAEGSLGFIQSVKAFSKTSDILVEEITKDQFDSIMSQESVRMSFDYYFPASEFIDRYEIEEIPGVDNIAEIKTLGFSSGSRESMFIFDGTKYFRVKSSIESTELTAFLLRIKQAALYTYYPIATFLGEDIEGLNSSVFLPILLDTSMETLVFSQEFSGTDDVQINNIAKLFFGDNFDFIRKIKEEGGQTIYMYGYGERVLIASPDGSIEYRSEVTSSTAQMNYFDALDTAMLFISEHGGFETADGQELSMSLRDVRMPEEKNQNYIFEFGMSVDDNQVYSDSAPTLRVEVHHGRVVDYQRRYIQFSADTTQDNKREAFSAVNALAKNYDYMYNALVKEGILEPLQRSDDIFGAVVAKISRVSHGYLIVGEELCPAWIVSFDDNKFSLYFDIDNAEPLGDEVDNKE